MKNRVVKESCLVHGGRGNGLLRPGSQCPAETDGIGRVSEVNPSACNGRAPLKQVLCASLPKLAQGAGVRVAGLLRECDMGKMLEASILQQLGGWGVC